MKPEFEALSNIAESITENSRDSRRLADLAVIAVLARRKRLLRTSRAEANGSALRNAIEIIAAEPLPKMKSIGAAWNQLAKLAAVAASAADSADGLDWWVSSSQWSDPHRKTRGSYATPLPFARVLAANTLKPLKLSSKPPRVMDPSVGTGALLLAVLRVIEQRTRGRHGVKTVYAMHGVEIDGFAREFCALALWLAAAEHKPELKVILDNIILDNAVTREWGEKGPRSFDAVIMNPPWESLRHAVSPRDAHSSSRLAMVERLTVQKDIDPHLPPLYSAQGRGDRNLFKAFLELAPHITRPGGRIGALIPAAFSSDLGLSSLRQLYLDHCAIDKWTSFENTRKLFPIDSRYKFGILTCTKSPAGTASISLRGFARDPADANGPHVSVTRDELSRLGGPSRMIPEVRSSDEMKTLSRVFKKGTPLFEKGSLGAVIYRREVDLTLGRSAGIFQRFQSELAAPLRKGRYAAPDGTAFVPVVEGRMIGQYDFFQKSWFGGEGRTATWRANIDSDLQLCRPQFITRPRQATSPRVAICDVTSATNSRTVHASLVPSEWVCGNTAPVLVFENDLLALAGLGILNSLVFDWVARHVVSGLHLNRFYLEALRWPILSTDSIERVAAAALALSTLNPRFSQALTLASPRIPDASLDFITAHVLIEKEVAAGYGLSTGMLNDMLASNRTDRRGFWRHYDTDRRIAQVAAEAILAYG